MEVSVLVFAGVLLGGVRSAPTPVVAPPELILQSPLLVPSASVPVTYVSRHHAQDELGQVNYGFSHPGQAKNEVRDASGNVAGVYTYIDEENKIIRVEYTAGKDGFRVKSNNLPEGVKDTAEVLAAKLQFVEAYNAAALAAATAEYGSAGEVTKSEDTDAINISFPVHVVHSPVKDTPEVIAEKLRFVEAYNAAALAAANAPDDPVEVATDVETKTDSPVNYNPVKYTPEVVAAKLQFVEAYNAAALAAAAAADDPESEDSSKAVITYASHPVQDTPEVIEAKLRFVEAYNAAAIAAALAPDDDIINNASQDNSATANTIEVTTEPLVNSEPVTDLGRSDAEVADVTSSPNEDDEAGEVTTVFPGKNHDELQVQTQIKKIHALKPVKVTEPPAAENEALVSAVQVPQAHSYSVGSLVSTSDVESPVLLTPTVHLTAPQINNPIIDAPVPYVSRHHVQDELGQVNYGFSHPGQAKNEVRDASGNVAGVYTYINDEDQFVHVEYTAGENGFQVRSNKLPEAMKDTPEVIDAKLEFVKAYNAAALAAAAAPDDGDSIPTEIASQTFSFVLPNPVKDTPEVIAAKLNFAEQYNAAALAAANAPDDIVDSSAAAELEQVNYVNPVHDTPEVIAAKLQFVETYNAAALAAAKATDDAGAESDSDVAIVYAVPVVQDTPEVIAAKLKFVEDYNAAAIAAALVPDDDIQQEKSETLAQDPKSEPASKNTNVLLPTLLSQSLDFANIENDISVPLSAEFQASNTAPELSIPLLPTPNLLSSTLPVSVVEVPVQHPSVAVPVTHITRHHAQDELGQVNYGFSHPGQTKNEIRDSLGNVRGVYTYVDSDDQVIHVEYTAGEGGFQVKSNNLPVGVRDTPEVLAAKLQFVEAYNAAALAAAAASDSNDGLPHEYEDSNAAASTVFVPTPVKDTPEVIAAKLQFVEAYNAAALAAANAPDDLAVSFDTSKTPKSPNTVQDTPEVIEAKLRFVDAYNSAAIAAAEAEDNYNADDSSKVAIVYATPVVQDTPEVIAAKLKFVEAYNAAALAAALAPDHVEQNDQEGSEILLSSKKPKDAETSTNTNLQEQYTIAYKTAPTIEASDLTSYPVFMRYSSFPAQYGESSSAIQTNPLPSGVYALHVPLGSTNGFLPLQYSSSTPLQTLLPYQNYGFSKQMVMYAPTYTYG